MFRILLDKASMELLKRVHIGKLERKLLSRLLKRKIFLRKIKNYS